MNSEIEGLLLHCPNNECVKPWDVFVYENEGFCVVCKNCNLNGPKFKSLDDAVDVWNNLPREEKNFVKTESIPLDLDNDTLLTLSISAHENNMSLNEYMIAIIERKLRYLNF